MKAKKLAEKEISSQLKRDRREEANAKYEKWLENHKNITSSKPVNKIKSLSELYSPVQVKLNPELWNGETEVCYDKHKILYTPFG